MRNRDLTCPTEIAELLAHYFLALLADLSSLSVTDFSIGESGSVKLVTAPTPTQQKAFDLLDMNPTEIFPAVGR